MVSIADIFPFFSFMGVELSFILASIILMVIFLPTTRKQKKELEIGMTIVLQSLLGIVLLIAFLYVIALSNGYLIDLIWKYFVTFNITDNIIGFYPFIIPQILLTIFFVYLRTIVKKPLFLYKKYLPQKFGKMIIAPIVFCFILSLPFILLSGIFYPLYGFYIQKLFFAFLWIVTINFFLLASIGIIDRLFLGYQKWLKVFIKEIILLFEEIIREKFTLLLFLISIVLPFLIFPQVSFSGTVTEKIDIRETSIKYLDATNTTSKDLKITPHLLRWLVVNYRYNHEQIYFPYEFQNKTSVQKFDEFFFIYFNRTFFENLNYTIKGETDKYRLGENFINWSSRKISDKKFSIEITFPETDFHIDIRNLYFPTLEGSEELICQAKCNESSIQRYFDCHSETRMYGNNELHFWGSIRKEKNETTTFIVDVTCE